MFHHDLHTLMFHSLPNNFKKATLVAGLRLSNNKPFTTKLPWNLMAMNPFPMDTPTRN